MAHAKNRHPKKLKTSTDKLTVMQNKCFQVIAGAFKATLILVLEAETFIAPIDVYLDQLQAKARYHLRARGQAKVILAVCGKITNKLQGKAGRKRIPQPTPNDQKHNWVKRMLANSQIVLLLNLPPPWSENPMAAHPIETKMAAMAV